MVPVPLIPAPFLAVDRFDPRSPCASRFSSLWSSIRGVRRPSFAEGRCPQSRLTTLLPPIWLGFLRTGCLTNALAPIHTLLARCVGGPNKHVKCIIYKWSRVTKSRKCTAILPCVARALSGCQWREVTIVLVQPCTRAPPTRVVTRHPNQLQRILVHEFVHHHLVLRDVVHHHLVLRDVVHHLAAG